MEQDLGGRALRIGLRRAMPAALLSALEILLR